ncbi:MAG: cytochrome P450 [Polyangiaceae bacterium]|nr:cytochrome P450 [Polyangiaceae bacterium]
MLSRDTLPPGPSNALLQTFNYTRDPYGWLTRMRETYGDVFTVRVVNGTVVVIGNPSGAQAIFGADPDTFVPFAVDAVRPMMGPNSMLFLTGARHRRERKLLMPPFHGDRMRAYGEIIRDTALDVAARWTPGKTMAFQDTSQAISLEVIIRAVFGIQGSARVKTVREQIIQFAKDSNPVLFFFPFLQRSFFGYGPWTRFQRTKDEIGAMLHAEIETRRLSKEPGADILSLMLAARHEDGSSMSSDELHDELLTLLFAGHETTGIALAWAIYWLLRNPDCMARAMAEIDALGAHPEPDALARLPYLDAVVHETLRLHPIVPDVPRQLARPLEVEGYRLPAGTGIAVATTLLHTRPDIYPEPERFRPERFLERKFSPFEYTPFGGGARRCLGAAFATYEMKIVLGTLLSRYRLVLAEKDEVKPSRRNIVLGPATGVRVVFIGPRAPQPSATSRAAA